MRRFKFRLETLLWHRRHLEETAATEFQLAHAKTLAAEAQLQKTRELARRVKLETQPCEPERLRMRDLYLELLGDRIARQDEVVQVLLREESVKREKWLEARRRREVVEKLREKAMVRHRAAELGEEQRDLDEWAVLRKAAAHAD